MARSVGGRAAAAAFCCLHARFTATAVGLAVAEGRFSLDDPVLAFFPEEAPVPNGFLPRLRVRHLPSMKVDRCNN